MRSLRLKLAAAGAAIAVVGALIPGISAAAPGDVFFQGTGLIRGSMPTDGVYFSITNADFALTCPLTTSPVTQGVDAYAFDLGAVAPSGATAIADGSNDLDLYDLDMNFYDAECLFLSRSIAVGTSETAEVPVGTRFIVVSNWIGVNTNISLTVSETAPTPEPTGEPQPEPSPTEDNRVRGEYPLTPDDPHYGSSTLDDSVGSVIDGFAPTQWGMRKIHAAEAWQEEQATGFKINVAVVDSGVDIDHPEFNCDDDPETKNWKLDIDPANAFAGTEPGVDDENGHGTHVAGIIGACTNNGAGVVGVAPDSTIIPVQVLGGDGSGTIEGIANGIRAATDSGAHVINMSLSLGVGALPAGGGALGWLQDPTIDAALEYAQDEGVVVVSAAGNDTTLPLCEYPAFYEGVVCVGASDPRDNRSWYGTGPNKLDDELTLVAPGGTGGVFCNAYSEEIFSTWSLEHPDTCGNIPGYRAIQGTSMATPHVAGVAALVYDRLGGVRSVANADAVIQALIDGAHDLGAPGYDPVFGAGRLDALASVLAVDVVAPPVNVTN